MVDVRISADGQVGPPTHAGAATATSTPPQPPTQPEEQPRTSADAERLEVARELIAEYARLVGFVRDADDRLTRIQAEIHEDTPPAARAVWDEAAQELRQTLRAPIQLTPGQQPVSLEDAAKTFRHWIDLFAENAIGPGGDGLHDDPERLAAFTEKLEAVDPPVTVLTHRTRDLLARDDLTIERLTRRAGQVAQVRAQDADRLAKLDPLIAQLKGSWTEQLDAVTQQGRALTEALTELRTANPRSGLASDAEAGLKALGALPIDQARQALAAILEWATKWHDEPSFTATTLATRIQADLAPPLHAVRDALTRISHEFSPAALTARDEQRRALEVDHAKQANSALAQTIHDRYQALVAVRRQKLGSDPDERYFGTIAKQVNDAITALADLELHLTEEPSEQPADATQLLADTERYVDAAKLEALLAAQAEVMASATKEALQATEATPSTPASSPPTERVPDAERRVATLEQRLKRLSTTLNRALTYTSQLEAILPARALAQYATLEELSGTTLDLGTTHATLAELIREPARTSQLLTEIAQADRTAASIEHDLTELETALGPAGRIATLVEQLTEYQRQHPLATLEAQHQTLTTLRGEARVRRHELANRQRELADASAERRALTPAEARAWLDLLTEQTATILARLQEVTETEARLDTIANHLDEPTASSELDASAKRLADIVVPSSLRNRQASSTPLPHQVAHTQIGERLRAELTPVDEPSTPDTPEAPAEVPIDDADGREIDIPIQRE